MSGAKSEDESTKSMNVGDAVSGGSACADSRACGRLSGIKELSFPSTEASFCPDLVVFASDSICLAGAGCKDSR